MIFHPFPSIIGSHQKSSNIVEPYCIPIHYYAPQQHSFIISDNTKNISDLDLHYESTFISKLDTNHIIRIALLVMKILYYHQYLKQNVILFSTTREICRQRETYSVHTQANPSLPFGVPMCQMSKLFLLPYSSSCSLADKYTVIDGKVRWMESVFARF